MIPVTPITAKNKISLDRSLWRNVFAGLSTILIGDQKMAEISIII